MVHWYKFPRNVLSKPVSLLKLLLDIIEQSNSSVDFLKGLVVLPKSLFIAKILKRREVDHIHSLATTSTAVMAHVISLNLKVPWSFTLHSSSVINSKYKRSFFFQARSASKCRAISQIISNDLSDFIGLFIKKVGMVHLGVDIAGFKKEKLFVNDPLIIVTPAELKTHKGHIYAIKAAKKLVDTGVYNFKWFFYGNGPLQNTLQEKVKELNLNYHCYFPGNIDHKELLDKYKNHKVDIVISSSTSIPDVFEGIPVSLMEAMSYEIPVIATDSGGTRELVDGKSGILVEQNDSDALADAILSLRNNSQYRKKLVKVAELK